MPENEFVRTSGAGGRHAVADPLVRTPHECREAVADAGLLLEPLVRLRGSGARQAAEASVAVLFTGSLTPGGVLRPRACR
ncbi:hypothetical protein [Nocardia sp. NPDC057227]|uniref:hypothetical protein n=1 Tax=Nocardia sp. NPDC057227 TaxID=3346056 RepID=UPI0036349419